MTIKICDRCGKKLSEEFEVRFGKWNEIHKYDLCYECGCALIALMGEFAKYKKEEYLKGSLSINEN